MPILKHKCPSAENCNSTECQHKEDHEKNEFCSAGCKHSKDSLCRRDLKGHIREVLNELTLGVDTSELGMSRLEALDAIMAAIKEEYGE